MSLQKQKGFTLLELMIVMIIIGILIGPVMNLFISNIEQKRLDVAVGEITDLYTSAQNYATNNNGEWPDQANNCAGAVALLQSPAQGYLVGFRSVSVYGTSYSLTCPVAGAGPRRFNVSLNVGDNDVALTLAGVLPSSVVSGSVLTASIPLPSELPPFKLYLPRDGSLPMTGDLDMDGNEIKDVHNIEISGTTYSGKKAYAANGVYFAGIVPANDVNTIYLKPTCPPAASGATVHAIPIVVPAGNSPTVNGSGGLDNNGTIAQANPIGAQYAWAESVGSGWRFRYKMAVYKNNTWSLNHRPNKAKNFLAVYMKCP